MKIDYIRLLRYGIGTYLLIGGLIQMDGVVILMGSVITLMAVFNVGCLGGQCAAPKMPKNTASDSKHIEDVTFEEVK